MPPATKASNSTTSTAPTEASLKTREAGLEKISAKLEADQKALAKKEADLVKREKALVKKVENSAGQSSAIASLKEGEVRIIAKRDGFRRAGMAHPSKSVVHEAGTFNKAQLQQLREENDRANSKLVVEFG